MTLQSTRRRAQAVSQLREHFKSPEATLNDAETTRLYCEYFGLEDGAETDLETVEQWAVDHLDPMTLLECLFRSRGAGAEWTDDIPSIELETVKAEARDHDCIVTVLRAIPWQEQLARMENPEL